MIEPLEKRYWETVTNAGEIKRPVTHPVVHFFSNQRIEYMKKYIDFSLIHAALDVGCGTGFSSFHFPSDVNLIGIDFSYRNLSLNPIMNKIQSSAYSLPFNSNSFDLVYGWDFLHHLDAPEKSILEMSRVTNKYLVIFEPNKNNPIQYIYALSNKNEKGTLKFNKKRLLELLDVIKFRLISCETVGWVFAGASPTFSLGMSERLPFSHPLGISAVMICEKT